MASRAIHLEVANSLETDSFINALRRFISRRGPVCQIHTDRGTNFVGAKNEFQKRFQEMNKNKVATELLKLNCDWIEMKTNVPHASHMGGVWERMIRTVRNVLSAIIECNGRQLNDEALRTFMCEVETIVNSRPLTTNNLNSGDSLEPLTPNHLLTLKSKVVLPPPGLFMKSDIYSRRWWRRVQHLTNEFWVRWKKEFLHSLQQRQQWNKEKRNLEIDDIVLITDENVPRNQWALGRVVNTFPSDDQLVRKVTVMLANKTFLDRPIQKLVLLLAKEEQVS
jgi:hypothetical protein